MGNLQRFLDDGDREAIHAIDRVNVLLIQLGDDVIDSLEFAENLVGVVNQGQAAANVSSPYVYGSSDVVMWSQSFLHSDQLLEHEDTQLLVELA